MRLSFIEKILINWGAFWGAIGIGLYFLGLMGFFYRPIVIVYGLICLMIFIKVAQKQKLLVSAKDFLIKVRGIVGDDRAIGLGLGGFIAFAILNFLIALAPEVGFDALWYHLTLPKIYLMTHHVSFIPGGLLYYSVMPRLGEMIYGLGLALNPAGYVPKIIHYFFGLFWFGAAYIFGRQFLSRRSALLAALAGYGTYAVMWLSQTAYIDLLVAFYAAMSLWAVFRYFEEKTISFLRLAAVFTGLALASKIYGLFLFAVMMGMLIFKTPWRVWLSYFAISLAMVMPFYLQAYFATGNPLYPLFSVKESALAMYTGGFDNLREWYLEAWWKNLPSLFWQMLIYRFTPVFGLAALIFFSQKWRRMVLPAIIYLVFFILWSLNPVQESRYFLTVVPILSVLSLRSLENINWKYFKILGLALLLMGLIYNFVFGLGKFKETLEMVFGANPRENYLNARLDSPLNFYDFSGNFSKEVKNQKVLTVNIHNLFYADFNFWDWSFIEDGYPDGLSARALALLLKKDGYDFVMVGESEKPWLDFSANETQNNFKFLFRERNIVLYKIEPQP